MGKPSRYHQGGRYRVVVEFDMPSYVPTRAALRGFISEALEIWGGQRHPEDELFHSLGQVKVDRIEKIE